MASMTNFAPGCRIKFVYTNHKGETRLRLVILESIGVGQTEWHPEDQWFLHCYDLEKDARRSFALKDIDLSSVEKC